MNIKKGDLVKIIAGEDKGKTGKVLTTYPADGKIVVEDVHVVSRHKKARSAQDTGGIVKNPAKIDVSNAMVVCPVCGLATKVGFSTEDKKGKQVKIRACKKCGASLEAKRAAAKAKRATTRKKAVKAEEAAVEAPVQE